MMPSASMIKITEISFSDWECEYIPDNISQPLPGFLGFPRLTRCLIPELWCPRSREQESYMYRKEQKINRVRNHAVTNVHLFRGQYLNILQLDPQKIWWVRGNTNHPNIALLLLFENGLYNIMPNSMYISMYVSYLNTFYVATLPEGSQTAFIVIATLGHGLVCQWSQLDCISVCL